MNPSKSAGLALTSAPFARRIFTTSLYPPFAAPWRAVNPFISAGLALTSAPFARRKFT